MPDMSPKDIARLDKEKYEEPGRDLLATKPAASGPGDVDNPVAANHSHGTSGPAGGKRIGSDENATLEESERT